MNRLLVFLIALLLSTAKAHAQEIVFTVSMPQPTTRLFHVEMQIPGKLTGKNGGTDLVLPVWTPGSYLVREYARNLLSFTATDSANQPLRWQKTRKNIWHIESVSGKPFTVRYNIYANEWSVRTAYLDDRRAFWNNAALLFYVDKHLDTPARLQIVAPDGWKTATNLPAISGTNQIFQAPNFDILYDSPVLSGNLQQIDFTVRNVPHRIVIEGSGNYKPDRLKTDVAKIVETEATMMGGLPYKDYTFFLMLRPTGGGGLEHLNGASLIFPAENFDTKTGYQAFLSLVAHEYFHCWNVKRIKPDALGPFDYGNENYTRLLWVAEGITSYYESVFVRRAELMDTTDYLRRIARGIAAVEQTPGRSEQSVEEASFDTWIKQYRPDEYTDNRSISYYTKGSVLGLLLDLTLRARTNGTKSLDEVMRTLWTDYALKNRNYTPGDFQRVCESVAGSSLEDFFAKYVRSRDEPDYATAFAPVGLQLLTHTPKAVREAYFGTSPTLESGNLIFKTVSVETPAYRQGLMTGDRVIAFDGHAITTLDQWETLLAAKRPDDTVQLTLFRDDLLKTISIKLEGRLPPSYRLIPVENPTSAQKRLYKLWLGVDFPAEN